MGGRRGIFEKIVFCLWIDWWELWCFVSEVILFLDVRVEGNRSVEQTS